MSFGVEFENIRLEIQRIKGEIESLEVRENAATTAEKRIIIIKQITALETQITALINQQTEIIKLSAGMAQKRLSYDRTKATRMIGSNVSSAFALFVEEVPMEDIYIRPNANSNTKY